MIEEDDHEETETVEYCEHREEWEEVNFTWCQDDNRWECPDCHDKHYDYGDLPEE